MSGTGQANVGGAVNSIPSNLSSSAGFLEGITSTFRFGINSNVGTTTEDIWEMGGTEIYLTSAETMDIFSDSANDTNLGTGANTLTIVGLDNDYNQIDEIVTLNGTTPVTTVNSYIRVNDMFILTSGSSETNEGTITCVASIAATDHSTILPEIGRSLKAQFTLPEDFFGFFTNWTVSGLSGDQAFFTFQFRPFGLSWQVGHVMQSYQSSQSITLNPYPRIPPKTDIRVRAKSLQGMGLELTTTYQLYLLDSTLIAGS